MGYSASSLSVASEPTKVERHAPTYGDRPTVIRQQTDCATGVVAGKDFISIAPTKVPALVIASGHLNLPDLWA